MLPYERTMTLIYRKEEKEEKIDTLYFSSTSRAPHLTVCVCPLPSPRRHEENAGSTR